MPPVSTANRSVVDPVACCRVHEDVPSLSEVTPWRPGSLVPRESVEILAGAAARRTRTRGSPTAATRSSSATCGFVRRRHASARRDGPRRLLAGHLQPDPRRPSVRDLGAHGIATWNVEYRRLGDPGGDWPGRLDDVVRAVDRVRELAARVPARSRPGRRDGPFRRRAARPARRATTVVPLRAAVSLAGVVGPLAIHRIGDDNGVSPRLLGGDSRGGPGAVAGGLPRGPPAARLPVRARVRDRGRSLGTEPETACRRERQATTSSAGALGAGHFEPVDPLAPEWAVVRSKVGQVLRPAAW